MIEDMMSLITRLLGGCRLLSQDDHEGTKMQQQQTTGLHTTTNCSLFHDIKMHPPFPPSRPRPRSIEVIVTTR